MEATKLAVEQRTILAVPTAALIALAIVLPCLLVGLVSIPAGKLMLTVAIVGSSIWEAIDSNRIRLREYRSQVSASPFVLFTASLGLWPIIFPAYLVVRSKILGGLVVRGQNPHERAVLYLCVAIWCLPLATLAVVYFTARALNMFQ